MERWMIPETSVGIPNHHTYSLNDICFVGRLSASNINNEIGEVNGTNNNKIAY